MRCAILISASFLSLPAFAWEFTPSPICTLTQSAFGLTTVITFDPATGIYALHLAHADGWADAPVFALRFEGAVPNTISTDRHIVDGPRLTVTDRGFGNVLGGLAGNRTAFAILGDTSVRIDLAGATDPVAAFRKCPAIPIS